MSSSRKVSFKEWETAIREAKQLTQNYDKVRFKIAEIAIKVCDRSKGGRKLNHIFSIKKFAEEIEINPKTLYEWIHVKELVIDKLPKQIVQKIKSYNYQDLKDVSYRCEIDTPPRTVKLYLDEQLNLPPENRKFIKYEKHLTTLLYNAQRPMNMILVDREIIESMLKKLDTISNLFKIELRLKDKFKTEERLFKNKQQIKNSISELSEF